MHIPLALLLAIPFLALPTSAAWDLKLEKDRIIVIENDRELLRYEAGRVPFIYPLPSPSGANLARRWPIEDAASGEELDHPHHRSMWFSHGSVNGFDFWSWHGKGEPHIQHLNVTDAAGGPDGASFTAHLQWVAAGQPLLKETRTYRFSRPDRKSLAIRFETQLVALAETVEFGDTKEGSFAVRVDRTLRLTGTMARGSILDSSGRTDAETWGKRSNWVAFHGPDELGEPAVIAMFDHPGNLRHPTWWHARDYGLLAANPFGIHDFEGLDDSSAGRFVLKKDESMTLRYLVLLHHGTPSSADLPAAWRIFSTAP